MFKKGKKVVQILDGCGVKTASIQEIESVKKGIVRLRNMNGLFDGKSGQSLDPSLSFCTYIVVLEE